MPNYSTLAAFWKREYYARWGANFRLSHYDVDVIVAFVALPFWAELEVETVMAAMNVRGNRAASAIMAAWR
jgi:hypothetical protein